MFVDKSWGRKMSCMKTVRSIIGEDGHDHYNESEVPESSDIIRKEDPYDNNNKQILRDLKKCWVRIIRLDPLKV